MPVAGIGVVLLVAGGADLSALLVALRMMKVC